MSFVSQNKTVVQPQSVGLPVQPMSAGTRSGLPTVLCYAASDLSSLLLALVGMRLFLAYFGMAEIFRPIDLRLAFGFVLAAFILNTYQGLYSTIPLKPAAELRQGWTSGIALAMVFIALQWMLVEAPRSQGALLLWLASSSIGMAVLLPAFRAACRMMFGRTRWWGRRLLLVGCNSKSSEMFQSMQRSPEMGLRPVGFVEDFEQLGETDGVGYLGPLAELEERVQESDVTLAIVGPRPEITNLVSRSATGLTDWLVIADCEGLPCLWTNACEVAGMAALGTSNRLHCAWRRTLKRTFDVLLVLALSPLLSCMVGCIALFVRSISPGASPFYASRRIGRNGRVYKMWKIRTMVANADAVLEEYLQANPELREEYERDHKLKNDPRIIPFGNFIRKCSLDELPQVWNIFIGDMSFVGPRPMLENERLKYGETFAEYSLVPPGITGMWQINGRNNTSYEQRLKYTEYYVKNWSLWLDLHILFCTVKVVLFREGAY